MFFIFLLLEFVFDLKYLVNLVSLIGWLRLMILLLYKLVKGIFVVGIRYIFVCFIKNKLFLNFGNCFVLKSILGFIKIGMEYFL